MILKNNRNFNYLCTAIISTYNGSKFLKGCLDDLIKQKLFSRGFLEIIIIDSFSEENEHEIASPFIDEHSSIQYLRTPTREGMYKAWNRGIKLAKGKYISNANVDDRHDDNCLDKLVDHLEKHPDSDIAYGNLFKSVIHNESFDQNDKSIPCTSQQFFAGSLLLHDFSGAQPVWRKSIHEKIGFFDESYDVAGDYEFVLRALTHGCKFSYVEKAEGLMLWHKNALSTKNSKIHSEKKRLYNFYRTTDRIGEIYKGSECTIEDAYLDLGIRSLCFYPQFNAGNPSFDFDFAKECFSYCKTNSAFVHNLKTIEKIVAFIDTKKSFNKSESKNFYFYGSTQAFPSEHTLKDSTPIYLKQFDSRELDGKKHQTYSFSLVQFENFFFGKLPLDDLSKFENLYICGFNQRGRLLGNWIKNKLSARLTFLDTDSLSYNYSKIKVLNYKDGIKSSKKSAFILAMSSHHWKTVEEVVKKKCPQSTLFYLDPS